MSSIDSAADIARKARLRAESAHAELEARAEAVALAAAARAGALGDRAESFGRPSVSWSAGAVGVPFLPVAAIRCSPSALLAAVARRAYFKAERRGFAPGRETEDWLEAESELTAAARALAKAAATDQESSTRAEEANDDSH